MTQHMTVSLPWPSRILSPNSRSHWAEKAKAAAKARRDSCLLCQAAGVRALPWDRMQVELIFCPPDKRPRDLDNMLASAKSLLDGVADATGVDDSAWSLTLTRGQPVKGGEIIVVVTEGVPVPFRSVGLLSRDVARKSINHNPEAAE